MARATDVIDLHCDTLTELESRRCGASDSSLHITPEKAAAFGRYIQVGAVWTDCRLTDEQAWERFDRVVDHYVSLYGVPQVMDVPEALGSDRAVILAVEGARLLAGDISRLDHLYERGVRILTLEWAGEDCIGGAWDTEAGLTAFGFEVVSRCFELGIVPDVSHASRKVTANVLTLARERGKAVIASHSDSYSVCPHERNLTDDEFREIASLGGVVGISMCPQHLAGDTAALGDVIAHVRHYLKLGGEQTVVLGCDFDGIETTPEGIADISALPRLYDALTGEFGEAQAKRVFFDNAYDFLKNNFNSIRGKVK